MGVDCLFEDVSWTFAGREGNRSFIFNDNNPTVTNCVDGV